MEEIKVKSATMLYFMIGWMCVAVLLWGVGEVAIHLVRDGFQWEMLILVLPIGLLSLLAFTMLYAYFTRKEFVMYRLEKKGTIDFDTLQQAYIQIADIGSYLFFVKEVDYFSYLDFKTLGSVHAYLPKQPDFLK